MQTIFQNCRVIDGISDAARDQLDIVVEGRSIVVKTPLLQWTKSQIVGAGHDLAVDYADTVSCYDPTVQGERVLACGHCDSCLLRLRGFRENGLDDPAPYQPSGLAK